MDRLLTRAQVAELLGASVMTIIRLEQSGALTPIKLIDKPGGMTRYGLEEVEALVQKRRGAAKIAKTGGRRRG
jgi:hypothetical protein